MADIHSLIIEKKYGEIISAAASGNNLNETDMFGKTPLLLAIDNDDYTGVEILLASGADPNQRDREKNTSPIGLAVDKGNSKIINHLLAKGADGGAELLHSAAAQDNRDLLDLLLGQGSDINLSDEKGKTPLAIACENDNRDLVEYLLKKSANIDQKDNDGNNPLSISLKSKNYKLFNLLVDYGADIYTKNDQGQNILAQSIIKSNSKLFEILLSKDFDLAEKDNNGKTCLYHAIKSLDKNFVVDLLDAGANLHEEYDGKSAVDIAMGEEAHKIVDVLISRGGTVKNFDVLSAVKRIVGDLSSKKFSIDKNRDYNMMINIQGSLDVHKKDESGSNALHYIVSNYNRDLKPLLNFVISKGCDINATDKRGATALHHAILSGNSSLARQLITHGANINAKDENNVSPYMLTQMLANLKSIEEPEIAQEKPKTAKIKASKKTAKKK